MELGRLQHKMVLWKQVHVCVTLVFLVVSSDLRKSSSLTTSVIEPQNSGVGRLEQPDSVSRTTPTQYVSFKASSHLSDIDLPSDVMMSFLRPEAIIIKINVRQMWACFARTILCWSRPRSLAWMFPLANSRVLWF